MQTADEKAWLDFFEGQLEIERCGAGLASFLLKFEKIGVSIENIERWQEKQMIWQWGESERTLKYEWPKEKIEQGRGE